MRDEVLDVELFDTLAEARVILADWHGAYNAQHPWPDPLRSVRLV